MSHDRIVLKVVGGDAQDTATLFRHAVDAGFHRFVSAGPRGPAGEEYYREDPEGIVAEAGGRRWTRRSIEAPGDLGTVRSELRSGRALLLRFPKERVLPLETLLAFDASPGEWMVEVDDLPTLPAALGALERGASRCVVPVRTLDELRRIARLVEPPSQDAIEWALVEVVRITSAGLGDRVIVDTTSLLHPEEGLLVGSAARLLVHVASEAEGSRYTRPRPFRINAGAAHSYTLLSDGSTRYLTELEPGDSVLVATPRGPARGVTVGRLKIERRPLSLVETIDSGRTATVFVQEAETVRLSSEVGRIPVTDLSPGTKVFAARSHPARHLGTAIAESIEER